MLTPQQVQQRIVPIEKKFPELYPKTYQFIIQALENAESVYNIFFVPDSSESVNFEKLKYFCLRYDWEVKPNGKGYSLSQKTYSTYDK